LDRRSPTSTHAISTARTCRCRRSTRSAAALDLAASNIRVNVVAPGPTLTPMLSRVTDGHPEARARRVPMGVAGQRWTDRGPSSPAGSQSPGRKRRSLRSCRARCLSHKRSPPRSPGSRSASRRASSASSTLFPDDAGRKAHLTGPIAAALMAKAGELLAEPPKIEQVDLLAAKLAK
jgi:hypothetical protein